MSNLTIGFSGILIMLVLMGLRVPIALALGGVSIIGLTLIRGPQAAFSIFSELPMEFGANWTLTAIPMFLLMGAIAFHSGMTSSLFEAARLWLGRLPGGLAVATNFASAGFAAASGSSLATCAAMGRLGIPEMLKRGYDPALASGSVAAAGTLGVLIPPSIIFVIYGWYSQTSIGKLLIAGIVPGLLTALAYGALIIAICVIWPRMAPRSEEQFTWTQKFAILLEIWPIPLLVLGVVGTIYGGIATATEAAAIGAALTAVIAAFRGQLGIGTIIISVRETLVSTAVIFFIAIGAMLFTRFLAFAGIAGFLTGYIGNLELNPITIILSIGLLYLILGCFLDSLGVLMLTLPVILPVFKVMELDPIWAGVILIKFLEIGLFTPPLGMNVFVVKGVVGNAVPLPTIFKGALWFLAAEVVVMTLLIAFPDLITFLPSLVDV
ncbi:TRAP transporter large permease [Paracoccus pantotrophus]|uniref:TRAP transporter large permease n=1 Tax=Paracoccus pantotrophus TaxID=82367 RepID=UPI00048CFF9C|nr:TRAP transporter large permease [Paracoccus pantotrophus]